MCVNVRKLLNNIENRRRRQFINLHKDPLKSYKLKYQIYSIKQRDQSTFELLGIIDENHCVHIMLPKFYCKYLSEDFLKEINENNYWFVYNTINRYTYISPNEIPLGNPLIKSNEIVLIVKDRMDTTVEVIKLSNFERK